MTVNRIMGRAKFLLLLVLVLAIGTGTFVAEYFLKSDEWVMFSALPMCIMRATLAAVWFPIATVSF